MGAVRRRQGSAFILGRSSCLYTRTLEPYAAPGCGIMVSTHVIHAITWITTHLSASEGWKAELAWLADPWRTVYPQSGLLLTVDRTQVRVSPPAKDRCQPPSYAGKV